MVRGFCTKCKREIGGFLRPPLWQCPTCWKVWCESCPKRKVGLLSKKPVCPECHVEMREGGLPGVKRSMQPRGDQR